MDHAKETEEEFDKETKVLEEIAEEAEHEREGHENVDFVVPANQHLVEPLKGPHHTPVDE